MYSFTEPISYKDLTLEVKPFEYSYTDLQCLYACNDINFDQFRSVRLYQFSIVSLEQ